MPSECNFRATARRISAGPSVAEESLESGTLSGNGTPRASGRFQTTPAGVSTNFAESIEVEPLDRAEETPSTFAEACRETGLAFLDGARDGWDKRDLAEWLCGPYRALANVSAEAEAADDGASESRHEAAPISERSIAELLASTRRVVVDALVELSEGEWNAVTLAMRDGHLEPARHAGELVWLPVDQPKMRLAARVLSLFLVDYLVDATPYEALTVCRSCDDVGFDGACASCHAPSSASYLREIRPRLASSS